MALSGSEREIEGYDYAVAQIRNEKKIKKREKKICQGLQCIIQDIPRLDVHKMILIKVDRHISEMGSQIARTRYTMLHAIVAFRTV